MQEEYQRSHPSQILGEGPEVRVKGRGKQGSKERKER